MRILLILLFLFSLFGYRTFRSTQPLPYGVSLTLASCVSLKVRYEEIVKAMGKSLRRLIWRELVMTKKKEAIQRLKMMGVDNRMVINPFKKGKLMLSEYLDEFFPAVLYDANQYTYLMDKISLFENTFNSMVYHVQLSHFTFGDCYSFFYVSDCKDEWDSDRYDLSHGFALAYVWNRTDEICSEFGSISFEPKFGGVVRQG